MKFTRAITTFSVALSALASNANAASGKDDEEIEIVVKYWDSKGKAKAKGLAKNGQFKHDISSLNTVSIMANRGQLKKLTEDPDIEFAEESQEMYALPSIRGSSAQVQRQLVESTPYGITTVQANLVSQGSTKIKICVVDTVSPLVAYDITT